MSDPLFSVALLSLFPLVINTWRDNNRCCICRVLWSICSYFPATWTKQSMYRVCWIESEQHLDTESPQWGRTELKEDEQWKPNSLWAFDSFSFHFCCHSWIGRPLHLRTWKQIKASCSLMPCGSDTLILNGPTGSKQVCRSVLWKSCEVVNLFCSDQWNWLEKQENTSLRCFACLS